MKKRLNSTFVFFILLLSWNSDIWAIENLPSSTLRGNLESMLEAFPGESDLFAIKRIADKNNSDIEVAFQNYIIAKKRVSIARAALNPVTTGQLLGISLGLNYLWAPLALEAVLSIPTKLYNISTNKYLAKAAFYNSHEAKLALNNELAHLYFDILTHEVILKTIDEEISVFLFHKDQIEKMPNSEKGMQNIQMSLIHLKMEKADIYNLYLEEIAALKTLLMMEPNEELKLSHSPVEIKKSFLEGLDVKKLQDFSVVNSYQYKVNLNLEHAAESNIKSTRWSILSFAGLNPSYRSRIRVSKMDANVAHDQKVSTGIKVRNGSLMVLNNFESSLNIFENYDLTYNESIIVMEDYYKQYTLGNATVDSVVETSISAIRDFRSKVVAQYAALASLDDLSKAVNFQFRYNREADRAQSQIEKAKLYDLSVEDFSVIRKSNSENSMVLAIDSDYNHLIEKVTYQFENNIYPTQTSDNDTKDFYSVFSKTDISENHFRGVARVYFYNGHECEVKFKL
ncbi:MAG: hypothetical protein KBD76_03005 [Bacteriovorax sp.]|nr:hypothetical protein [Bacteriovorax sp.]